LKVFPLPKAGHEDGLAIQGVWQKLNERRETLIPFKYNDKGSMAIIGKIKL
jgi:NADH dehydrogenase FAD-containing subunit